LAGITVRWREGGHRLDPATDVLRFEVTDINRIITTSAAATDVYGEVQRRAGVPEDWQVLVLSCFAITPVWTPVRLADGTGFSRYRTVRAEVLAAAGVALWPTEVFVDDVADPRNEVHYDLVVAAGKDVIPVELAAPDKRTRAEARNRLKPMFETVLNLLGEPQIID
jgi:hypothetical protein